MLASTVVDRASALFVRREAFRFKPVPLIVGRGIREAAMFPHFFIAFVEEVVIVLAPALAEK